MSIPTPAVPTNQRVPVAAERSVAILGATGSIGASTIDLIKRERASEANAFFHSTTDFGRLEIFETAQPDHLKFLFHDFFHLVARFISVLQKRERNVLAYREGCEQCAGLE